MGCACICSETGSRSGDPEDSYNFRERGWI
ncbi:hypothetical protein NXF25_014798 [Crotalus adamanteus]|uniref:Uncharacterized protein n=1 Tax=Crotalus adamanteus TaxID=8729 RepID=A0AAW1AXT2_CROAD